MCNCYIQVDHKTHTFYGESGYAHWGFGVLSLDEELFKTMSMHKKEVTILMAVFICLRDETLDQLVALLVPPKLYLGYQIIYFQVV